MSEYPRVATLRTATAFRTHVARLGIDLPIDDVVEGKDGPLAQPYTLPDGFQIGNRLCVHPMEGWDGTSDGRPSELTMRRWRHFGQSGAKLIWGGEAVAVRADGRANPNQLLISPDTLPALTRLREALVATHESRFGCADDLLVGLQLTHSGRFARPRLKDKPEPVIVYRHPLLDAKVGLTKDHALLDDDEIERLTHDFVNAAVLAANAGFAFVDIKHCHGYLGHEFLTAHTRSGRYGGTFENRTRFLREIVAGIRERAPRLRIGVRLSAFDTVPFRMDADGRGISETAPRPYPFAFGADPEDPLSPLLDEAVRFLELLESLQITLVNITAGSPYYSPHIQRPALFPPSDGYAPPEDPLVGVARQMAVTTRLKQLFPRLAFVGSAYSYLQEWLPHAAQHAVRTGRTDFVGLGRIILAYPDLPADILVGRTPARAHLCRTFSDCTNGPRAGLVSGCYPLDPFYRSRPEAEALRTVKTASLPARANS